MTRYFKTMITVEVLSEDEVDEDMSLLDIVEEATTGAYSYRVAGWAAVELTPKEMADALIGQSSSPEFFGLNEDGTSVSDDSAEDVGEG